jgi:hypothetical protein
MAAMKHAAVLAMLAAVTLAADRKYIRTKKGKREREREKESVKGLRIFCDENKVLLSFLFSLSLSRARSLFLLRVQRRSDITALVTTSARIWAMKATR